jgi:type II secretory pathway pseudopilin PulG
VTRRRPEAVGAVAAGGRASRHQRGVTVIELLVAVLIGIMLTVIAAVSLREIDRVNVRSGSRLMAATVRFGFDRARSTGRDHRLVFDLQAEGGATLTFEMASKGKQLMPRDLDEAWKQHHKFADGEEAEELSQAAETTTIGGLSKNLLALPRPMGPQWQKVTLRSKSATDKLAKAARLVKSIYVARLDQEIEEGKVALHIWRGGFLERAAIYLSDGKTTYTLVTYPLTGRVKIHLGRVELSADLLQADDTGQRIEER